MVTRTTVAGVSYCIVEAVRCDLYQLTTLPASIVKPSAVAAVLPAFISGSWCEMHTGTERGRGFHVVRPGLRRDCNDSFDPAYSGPFRITSMTHTAQSEVIFHSEQGLLALEICEVERARYSGGSPRYLKVPGTRNRKRFGQLDEHRRADE